MRKKAILLVFFMARFIIQTGFIQVDDVRRRQLPGFGYNPEQKNQKGSSSRTRYGRFIRSLWKKSSNPESQSADIELQRKANAGLQELGMRADAGAGRDDEFNMGGYEGGEEHSRNRIMLTTTVTVVD
ncbi:MAG: hypothetical protein Q9161_002630 [Pseudevernia consocians]